MSDVLAPMRANGNLPSLSDAACIVHPPAFPALELAVPHDAAAGIETLVEHALGDTVAGIGHLPTPDSLNAETVFGPSYSRLTRTGLDDATARGIARWGGAVFFISNHLAEAREQMATAGTSNEPPRYCRLSRPHHRNGVTANHQPVAVMLDFVNPQHGPDGGRATLRRLARFDEAGGMPSLKDHGRRMEQWPGGSTAL
jgi:hypothetical protein